MSSNPPLFRRLDHIAIVVNDTDDALRLYRDQMGLPVVIDEVIESGGVRLTHLDMGNVHLQLVMPMTESHPLREFLDTRGPGLHHLCFETDDVGATLAKLPQRGLKEKTLAPHDGPLGKKAGFVDSQTTGGVIWEMTDCGTSPPQQKDGC